MARLRKLLLVAGAVSCVGLALLTSGAAASAKTVQAVNGTVVIAHGQPVQIVVAVDDTGIVASSGPSLREAVQVAIERHPVIRGFPIQINAVDAPCRGGTAASLAESTAIANGIVANAQNVAVIGHVCSAEAPGWLPPYEAAGLLTINGSVTGASVPALGPTVFNGTAVPDQGFDPWYAAVKALPSDLRWRSSFQARFGSPPADFADLYYDAATVLVAALQRTARIDQGNLVIDRAALDTALRGTRGFPGVTCSITLDALTGFRVNDPAALARCAGTASQIVFASDRASANPGEIYSLSAGRAPVNVSRSPMQDSYGAISPDGKLVAFMSARSGTLRVYLARPDGGGLRLLPVSASGARSGGGQLVFSPDGSRLLVVTGGTPCTMVLVNLRSRRTTRAGNGCANASWSPDGSRIVAFVGPRSHQAVFDTAGHRVVSVPGMQALWSAQGRLAVVSPSGTATVIVDERGSRLARLPEAAAAWSADGSRLLLTRPGALLLSDSRTLRHARVLVRGPKNWSPSDVAFTPDGAFVRYTRPSGTVVAVPVTGGTPRILPGHGIWARDERYAFTRPLPAENAGGLSRIEIEVGDRFGRHARKAGVFAFDDHGGSSLTWSANGSRLLYETSVRAPRDLWAVDADGSNLHRLTPGGPDASAPAWSADGTRLAYTSAPFTGGLCGFCLTTVVVAGADGGLQSTVPGAIPGQASGDAAPAWDPSGTQLVVSVCCSGELDAVDIDGSGRLPLVPGPLGTFASVAAWSPDDSAVAYLGSGGSINLIAPDGSAQRVLLPEAGEQAPTALAWSHDGGLLAYSAPDGIHVLAANGSSPPRLVVAARSAGGLDFSPDGSQLVYAAQRQEPTGAFQSDLFVVPLLGGPSRLLAPSPYEDALPAWQPLPGS